MLEGWPFVRAVEAWQSTANVYQTLARRVHSNQDSKSPAQERAVSRRLQILQDQIIEGARVLERAVDPDNCDLFAGVERMHAQAQAAGEHAFATRLQILKGEVSATLDALQSAREGRLCPARP